MGANPDVRVRSEKITRSVPGQFSREETDEDAVHQRNIFLTVHFHQLTSCS